MQREKTATSVLSAVVFLALMGLTLFGLRLIPAPGSGAQGRARMPVLGKGGSQSSGGRGST
ncbi:MAG: hypothetical protein ACE5LS_02320 [Thermoplasmata archaeon]